MIRQLPVKPRRFFELFEEFGRGSIARLPTHQNGGLEIHYISSGHLHWQVENKIYLVPPRSFFFTFPWERHGGTGDFELGHYFHFAVFRLQSQERKSADKLRFVPEFAISEQDQIGIFRKLLSSKNRYCPASPALAVMMPRLVDELSEPGPLAKTKVIAYSQAILCELALCMHQANQKTNADSSSGRERILQFIGDLWDQCDEPWTLSSMAAACKLGRTRFETLTKEITGDAPAMLINRLRVRRAQQLLKESDKTITDIAFQVGFNSSQYFSRIFQTLTGITPLCYRQNHGGIVDYDRRFLKALGQLRQHS
ncbi:MAG: helix-turn-helix transcriptional regulator [Verrucomicrobiales bacterium]|jgi:AraC-like DNA-binding protein|nr:helix-turn-helix transcriptional regulator [Verrucomicrobiales bacterium]